MKRILFVDDEELVLGGLRRSLFPLRKEWRMEFCTSPQRACELLGAEHFDVVVSDMRMPGMDGAEFLERVAKEQPSALRVILSGQSEMEATVRAAVIAHQFIAKPCEPSALSEVLGRTLLLHQMLDDEELRSLVNRIKGLPTPPSTFQALSRAMADPDVELGRIAAIIEGDVGLVVKLLQLVNSSFFGLARRVSSVREAVSLLGVERIKSVVLSSEVHRQFDARNLPAGFDLAAEAAHAQLTASIARRLLQHDKPKAEFAFLAAMLHDVGLWILAACLPSVFAKLHAAALRAGRSAGEIDIQFSRLPHPRLGAYLLGIWGLPYPVVEAVAYYHAPSLAGATTFDALGAVHVASCLSRALRARDPEERARQLARLDADYLRAAGLCECIDAWFRDACREAEKAA